MVVVKWILLIACIGLTLWLIIDTTIWIVKKVKKKKLQKMQEQNNKAISNDESTSE